MAADWDWPAEIIVVCDPAGTIIQASREADEFWRKSVLGHSFGQVFPLAGLDGSDLKDTADLLKGCLAGKAIRGVEVNLRRPKGGTVDMLMIGLGGDPNKIQYDGYYEDVYVKTPQGWRFKQRTHHALLNGGRPATPPPAK